MPILNAVFYGILQGLTEFLPVSSSGHLALLRAILGDFAGSESFLTFEVLLHVPTLLAVMLGCRKQIALLFDAFALTVRQLWTRTFRFRSATPGQRLLGLLILATLPMIAILPLRDRLEFLYGDARIVSVLLLLNGLMLLRFGGVRGSRTLEQMRSEDALTVGMCQMMAVLPGLSRSGCTVSAGLSRGIRQEDALHFSFLLSIPTVGGAFVCELPSLIAEPPAACDRLPLAMGMCAALLAGLGAIWLLHWTAKKAKFSLFGWYCILAGSVSLLLQFL